MGDCLCGLSRKVGTNNERVIKEFSFHKKRRFGRTSPFGFRFPLTKCGQITDTFSFDFGITAFVTFFHVSRSDFPEISPPFLAFFVFKNYVFVVCGGGLLRARSVVLFPLFPKVSCFNGPILVKAQKSFSLCFKLFFSWLRADIWAALTLLNEDWAEVETTSMMLSIDTVTLETASLKADLVARRAVL